MVFYDGTKRQFLTLLDEGCEENGARKKHRGFGVSFRFIRLPKLPLSSIETLLIPFCFTFVYFRFPSNGDIKGFAFAMNSFRG